MMQSRFLKMGGMLGETCDVHNKNGITTNLKLPNICCLQEKMYITYLKYVLCSFVNFF